MSGSIASLYVHPVKGFTPQRVDDASLSAGRAFPGDRLFAVEDGPCGFDPAAPSFIPKQRFAVLAKEAAVAQVATHYNLSSGVLAATAPGQADFHGAIGEQQGESAFSAWFSGAMAHLLGSNAGGPYRLIAGGGHRFLDHPLGHVSVLNLASVADLAQRLGRPIDPLRFRANVLVKGWAPWVELGWEGKRVRLGGAETRVFKPIVRCAATEVDPASAARDIAIPAELHRLYGHVLMGIYVQVVEGGEVRRGDAAQLIG